MGAFALDSWAIWTALIAVLNASLAIAVTIHAVLWKRESRAVIGWVGVAWLAPIVGSLAYICFGINRIERKAAALNIKDAWEAVEHPSLSAEDESDLGRARTEFPNLVGLAAVGGKLTDLPLMPGNHVEPLINGDAAFPEMVAAIQSAEKSIALASYIFDNDRIGEQFLEALVAAKNRGVEVRVLIDDVGARYTRPTMASRLKDAGIPCGRFLPIGFTHFAITINMRNHRKILIVDGTVGFTGGTNIREGHALEMNPKVPVQCLHFRLNGPVVAQLMRVFAIDWAFVTGETLSGPHWFTEIARSGSVWARGIEHGPDKNFEKLVDLMTAAIACARERIRIVTPYFLPTTAMSRALGVAALRGVDVEIYLPSNNNIPVVEWACLAELWQVLEKGCRVFQTVPPFDHTKLMIVDDAWTLIGSTNWDPRSLRLNFEFNVECYSLDLAQTLTTFIDEKATNAREITLADVDSRSYPVQVRDGIARLLTPYL